VPTLYGTKFPGNTQGQIQPNWSFALSEVHTFSPTLFNELLVTGTRTMMNVLTGDPSVTYDSALGLPNPFGVKQWPGLYDLAYNSNMLYQTQNGTGFSAFYGIVEDNATKGKHELQLAPLPFRPHEPAASAPTRRRQRQLEHQCHVALRCHHAAQQSRGRALHRRSICEFLPGG
jgi:hypothetical protein